MYDSGGLNISIVASHVATSHVLPLVDFIMTLPTCCFPTDFKSFTALLVSKLYHVCAYQLSTVSCLVKVASNSSWDSGGKQQLILFPLSSVPPAAFLSLNKLKCL